VIERTLAIIRQRRCRITRFRWLTVRYERRLDVPLGFHPASHRDAAPPA